VLHAREHKRSGAHRAWLDRGVYGAVSQPFASEVRRRLRYRYHLGVGGRVLQHLYLVVGARDYPSVMDDHCAYRHFIRFKGLAGLLQRLRHKNFIYL